GWTSFYFVGADDELVRQSMETAWRNVAPRSLVAKNGRH
ncbi:MmcQ/YjbR family DNA-binding protein, partial [Sinorhizobium meliloti]